MHLSHSRRPEAGTLQRIRIAAEAEVRRHLRGANRTAALGRRPRLEAMEGRVLLSAYSINDVANFGPGSSGTVPSSALVADSNGNFFGTALEGTSGAYQYGTIFDIAKGTSTITNLATFNYDDGAYPGQITLDSSGNIYGTTSQDGNGYQPSFGEVFELPKGSSTITALATFDSSNGSIPKGRLAIDDSGNLYGTSYLGGSGGPVPGDGTVFEVAKGSNSITTVATFDGPNGANPASGITSDASGNLFGTTSAGGSDGDGTVFELPSGSRTLTTLGSFNGTDGNDPWGGMTLDGSGNLYGTAEEGGASNDGTVFEIAGGTRIITAIASFNGTNGSTPQATTAFDASGDLDGTTENGGANGDGTVSQIANGSSTISALGSFNGTNGKNPLAPVTLDASGNIFGTASAGGANNDGVIFKLVANPVPTVSLALTNGSNPSNVSRPLTFTATVSGGIPNGETVSLEDASNQNTLVASGTTSNGSATLNVPAGTLLAGTHNLIAVYGGDANFAASESPAYTQNVLASPTVTGISPSSGPATGGTTVTITGSGFTGATAVDFGTNPASNFTVNSTGTQITALDPAGTGTVDVTVVTPGGTSVTSPADKFTYVTVTPVSITSAAVNGNNVALAGVQRSMVNSIVYSFSEAVLLGSNAFSIALNSTYASGTLPTLTWTAINPNADGSSTQWAVTFSGAGVLNGSIADGVYNITLNGSAVTSDANPSVTGTSRTDTFYRLFGDATGTGSVTGTDYNALLSTFNLKSTAAGYLGYFNEDGADKIDAPDYNAFLANFGARFKNVTTVTTI